MSSFLRTTAGLRTTLRTPLLTRLPLTTSRPLSIRATPLLSYPRKDSQDKDSMEINPTEYSKSGGDQATAQTDAAFDPSSTSPEHQEKQAAQETGSSDNPLNASPGNHEISQPNDEKKGGAERSSNEANGNRRQSGGGSGFKSGPQETGSGQTGSGGRGGNA